MLQVLMTQTAAGASKVVLLCFGVPVLSFRSSSYPVYYLIVELFRFVTCLLRLPGGARILVFIVTGFPRKF